MGYLSYRSGQQTVNELACQLVDDIGDRIDQHVDSYLSTAQTVNQMNWHAVQQGVLDVNDFDQMERYFAQQFDLYDFGFINFGGVDGSFIGVGYDNHNVPVIAEVPRDQTDQINIYSLKDGKRGQRLQQVENPQVLNAAWYTDAVTTAQPIWTSVYNWADLPDTLAVSASAPVFDDNQQLLGVIGIDVKLDQINQFLRELKIGKTGVAFILEPDEQLIASSSDAPTHRLVNGIAQRLDASESQDPLIQASTVQLLERFGQLRNTPQDYIARLSIADQPTVVRVRPYTDEYGLNWFVVVALPEADFAAALNANQQQTLLLCSTTLLLATLTGALTSRWIADPIRRLQQAANAITQGQLSYPIQVSGVGEVAQLSAAFQQMARQLDASFQSLQASEQQFSTLFNDIPIGISLVNNKGQHVLINQKGQAILGQQAVANLAVEPFSAVNQIFVAGTAQRYPVEQLPALRALRGETVSADDIEIEREGERIPLDVSAIPVVDNSGNVICAIYTFQDITERRRAEQLRTNYERELERRVVEQTHTLKEFSDKINDIINSAGASIASSRFYRDRTYQNDYHSIGCITLTGFTPQELTSEFWMSRIVPEDLQAIFEPVFEAVFREETITVHYRFRHKDGSLRWIEDTLTSRWSDAEQCWIVTMVGVDITHTKNIEASLRLSEERFRKAFDDAPIGMALISCTGDLFQVNHSLCDILGYPESELLTLNVQTIIHPDDLNIDQGFLQSLLADEIRFYQIEKRAIHCMQHVVYTLMSVSVMRDSNYQPIYFIVQVQDISDRYAVDRMKSEFISIVSHELRTPIAAISGALDLLSAGVYQDQPEKADAFFKIALTNSDRLTQLLNDILTLERLEPGKSALAMAHCEVSNLLQHAIEAVQNAVRQANVKLVVRSGPVQVWADSAAIVQTLTNLLNNAIKFSPYGSTIWLNADQWHRYSKPFANLSVDGKQKRDRNAVSASDVVLFSIQDEGQGIPPDQLTAIFDRFQQVNASDSRQAGGTGLGLAICKSIVQQHGGDIWVESRLAQGSTFYFTLPLAKPDQTAS